MRPPPTSPPPAQKTSIVPSATSTSTAPPTAAVSHESPTNSNSSSPSTGTHPSASNTPRDKGKDKGKTSLLDRRTWNAKSLLNLVSKPKTQNNSDKVSDYLATLINDNNSGTDNVANNLIAAISQRSDKFTSKEKEKRDWGPLESTPHASCSHLIDTTRCVKEGYKIEYGKSEWNTAKQTIQIDYLLDQIPNYYRYFYGKDHKNYICDPIDESVGPVIISFEKPPDTNELPKVIIRTKDGAKRFFVPDQHSKNILKYIKSLEPKYENLKFTRITVPSLQNKLVDWEKQGIINKYKWGVLNVLDGQTDENDMFSNNEISPDFKEFLEFMGDRIVLSGWDQYRGGLDNRGTNTTGTESVYTKFVDSGCDFEIMYHVSALLPFQKDDLQRVERKRHLGNDIVMILFKEGKTPFDPLCLTTQFNNIFCVIQKDPTQKKTHYMISIVSKTGVPPCPPYLKSPPIYEKGPQLRDFLLTKLINCERAAMIGPDFKGKTMRTNQNLLADYTKDFIEMQKEKVQKEAELKYNVENIQEEDTFVVPAASPSGSFVKNLTAEVQDPESTN